MAMDKLMSKIDLSLIKDKFTISQLFSETLQEE